MEQTQAYSVDELVAAIKDAVEKVLGEGSVDFLLAHGLSDLSAESLKKFCTEKYETAVEMLQLLSADPETF